MEMDRITWLLITMTVFTGVAAIALLIMMGMMIGVYRSISEVRKRSIDLMDHVQPLAVTSRSALEDFRIQTSGILVETKKLTLDARRQMDTVDGVLTDVRTAARLQMERIDRTLEANLERLEDTTKLLQQTVMTPMRHVRGAVAAADATIKHLITRRRPTVDRATLDEEMFI